MFVKKVMKSKKAISPILATLLLIVIAVAAIVVTYAWIMTYMSSTTGQAGIFLKKDAVNWPTSSSVTVYVRNTGTADATIDSVFIGTSSTNLAPAVQNASSQVVVKDGGTVAIGVTYDWDAKTTYYFRVSPKVGEALVFQENSP